MGDQDDILHIAKYFVGRYGAAAAALMESRASACEREDDAEASSLWRSVATAIRKAGAAAQTSCTCEADTVRPALTGVISDSHVRFAFEATPHPYLLLTPDLRIAGANDCYLRTAMMRREDLLGRQVFEAMPDNPEWSDADGVRNLSASLARVIDQRKPDRMPLQRHDVRRADGVFEERWWSATNTPAFDASGRLVIIVHHAQELKTGGRGRA
jgi:hypothetical protein